MEVNNNRPAAPVGPVRTAAPIEQAAAPAPAEPAAPQPAPMAPVALAWNPVHVDLDQVDTNMPDPPMWDHGNKPVQGRTFTTWGDPHEITGDNLKFDNMKRGEFVKLMSATGDFILQTRQDAWIKNPMATVNTAAAVKLGADLVVYDLNTKSLKVNGLEVSLEPGTVINLPDGGKVTVNADSIDMVSPRGDKVSVLFKENYIDVTGEVAASRKDGEIRGSLGAFDNDTDGANDLMGRFGKQNMGAASNQKVLDAFLETWRASGGESLFKRSDDLEFFSQIDGKELLPTVKEYFLKYYDLNSDGEITKNEFLASKAAQRAIGNGDTNNDGRLTGFELNAESKTRDRNKDGKVDAHEFLLYSMGWNILKSLREDYEAEQKKRDAAAGAQKPAAAFPPARR